MANRSLGGAEFRIYFLIRNPVSLARGGLRRLHVGVVCRTYCVEKKEDGFFRTGSLTREISISPVSRRRIRADRQPPGSPRSFKSWKRERERAHRRIIGSGWRSIRFEFFAAGKARAAGDTMQPVIRRLRHAEIGPGISAVEGSADGGSSGDTVRRRPRAQGGDAATATASDTTLAQREEEGRLRARARESVLAAGDGELKFHVGDRSGHGPGCGANRKRPMSPGVSRAGFGRVGWRGDRLVCWDKIGP